MKRRLLFAMLCIVSALGMRAQSWTASEVGEGNFMLYNVGTGQYLTRGNGWGTQASITTTGTTGNGIALRLAGSGSDFKMFTGINGDAKGIEHLDGGTIYLDQANGKNSTWTFTQVATDNGPVYTIVSKDNHGGGGGAYLTAGADGTKVTPGSDGTIDGAKWKLMSIPAQPIGMDNASESNPVDATSLIVNANFSFDAILKGEGWTMQSSNYNACGGNVTGGNVIYNPCAESWRAAFTLSQTITVPNGVYELTAQAALSDYAHLYNGNDYPVVYANDATAVFNEMEEADRETSMTQLSNSFTAGKYKVGPIRVVVTNGSLTIGVRGTRIDTWCIWDNFKLTYKGLDLSELKAALQAQIDAVPALEGTTTTAAYNAAKTYADGINMDNLTTEEAISTASVELAALVDAAKALQADYSRYQTIKSAALNISENVNTTNADNQVNAATTNDEINTAIATLRAALGNYLAGAGIEDDEIDLTAALIDNANPGTAGSTDFWTASAATGYGNNLYEYYNKDGAKFSQIISTALPAGYYTYTVVGYTRTGYNAYMYANGNQQTLAQVASSTVNNLPAGNSWIAEGNGTNNMTFQLENSVESLEIGINSGTEGDKWTAWRSFKLVYLGTAPLSVFQTRLAEAATAANTHAEELVIPAAAKTAYTSAISAAAAKNASVDECLQSIADIEAATVTAESFVVPYATYKLNASYIQALYEAEYEELTEGAHETLGTALNTAATDVESQTTIEGINNVYATLKAAGATYAGAANPTGEAKFNLTFMLTNPDVSSFPAWTPRANVPGWYTDQTDGNSQTMVNDAATSEDGTKTHFFEYWSNPAKANDAFALYQKVTLPVGTYDISCYAFAQDQYAGTNSVGVYFYANDTQGSAVTTARLTQAGISFVNAAEQEVKIGLKTIAGNSYNWMGIGYVELYKVPAKTFEINETMPYDNTQEGAGDVTLKRTIKAGFNTLVLPFSMTQNEVEENFGVGSVVYTATAYANGNISFATKEGISANEPVLLKATEAGTEYTLEGRTIVAGNPVKAGTNVQFVGNYAASLTVPTENYIISGGKIYLVNSTVTIKNTRAYLSVTEPSGVKSSLTMTFDDGTETSIEAINTEIENGLIYNLAGQRVSKAQKGIYIKNGRKVVVK